MTATCVTIVLEHMSCGICGVVFGLERSYVQARRQDHETWHCPNGHKRYFPAASKTELAEREATSERARAEFWQRRSEENARRAASAEHSRRTAKGHLTRVKKRIAAGVCPCCTRTFQNLARHIQGQHPGYGVSDA